MRGFYRWFVGSAADQKQVRARDVRQQADAEVLVLLRADAADLAQQHALERQSELGARLAPFDAELARRERCGSRQAVRNNEGRSAGTSRRPTLSRRQFAYRDRACRRRRSSRISNGRNSPAGLCSVAIRFGIPARRPAAPAMRLDSGCKPITTSGLRARSSRTASQNNLANWRGERDRPAREKTRASLGRPAKRKGTTPRPRDPGRASLAPDFRARTDEPPLSCAVPRNTTRRARRGSSGASAGADFDMADMLVHAGRRSRHQ